MDDLTINRHSFHSAVENLELSIKKRPEDVAVLPTFKEKALYIFDQHITAKEMNSFVETLQGTLIDSNIIIEGALNEIKGIYIALDKLDNDYIDGIVAALKKAKNAIDKAETSLAQVKTNSEQNTKTLIALKQTIEQFTAFKNNVNKALPLIPEHSETLNKVSGQLKQVVTKIGFFEQKITEAKTAAEKAAADAIGKSEKALEQKIVEAKDAAEKIAADALGKSEKALEQKIVEAKATAEKTAADAIGKSEKALEQKIAEAKATAEKTSTDAIGKSEKVLEQKIVEAKAAAEKIAADALGKSEKALEQKIVEAKAAAEKIVADALGKSEKALEQKIAEAKAIAEKTSTDAIGKSEKVLEQKIVEAKATAEKTAADAIGKSEKALEQKIIIAYAIGGVGILCSIVVFILSLINVI